MMFDPNNITAPFDAAVSKNIKEEGYAYALGRLSSCVAMTLLSSLPEREAKRLLDEMAASLTREW